MSDMTDEEYLTGEDTVFNVSEPDRPSGARKKGGVSIKRQNQPSSRFVSSRIIFKMSFRNPGIFSVTISQTI